MRIRDQRNPQRLYRVTSADRERRADIFIQTISDNASGFCHRYSRQP